MTKRQTIQRCVMDGDLESLLLSEPLNPIHPHPARGDGTLAMGSPKAHHTNMGSVSSTAHLRLGLAVLFFCAIVGRFVPVGAADVGTIITRMEAAYAKVEDYQAHVEVKNFGSDGSVKVERFLYSFKKPKWIRLDMETPHPGMVLIYPDEKGKVFVRPGGWMHFSVFHLSPDNRLLKVSSEQRLDQTDMGQLITKISHSVTDEGQGPVSTTEEGGNILIRVLAADHFRPGVTTLYRFRVDESSWLPVEVEEATPAGVLERTVTFHMLRINTGITQAFFGMGSG